MARINKETVQDIPYLTLPYLSTKRSCDPLQPTVTDVIEFLTEIFQSGIGYSCLNTARSALSAVIVFPDNTPAGSHPLVIRFMKNSLNAHNEVKTYA